jgi:hypothetical protein
MGHSKVQKDKLTSGSLPLPQRDSGYRASRDSELRS